GCLALRVGGGALGVVLYRARFELLLPSALGRFPRGGTRGLGGGELGERSLQRRGSVAPVDLCLSHFLLEPLELGAPLERTPGRGPGQEHGTVSPSQRAPPRPPCLATVEDLVAREERPHPRARALSSAWAAGASPTRSRSSSASASRRAVTCASAASAWRRAVRSCVSCSLSSATRRRACSNAAAASAAARARAAASCARAPTWAVAAHSVSARRARSCGAPQVALQPPRLELRICQAALHLGATRLGRVPR